MTSAHVTRAPESQSLRSERDTIIPSSTTHFVGEIHRMRGLAIVLVVACHVTDGAGWGHEGGLRHLAWAALGNATVPFVFVSGYLFHHLSGRFRYLPYLRKRFENVVIPYLIVTTPTLIHQYLNHSDVFADSSRPAWFSALSAYSTAAHMPIPFWYIPTIALFYVASQGLVALGRSKALPVATLGTLLVALVLHRSREHRCVWQSALYFLPVYLLGIWVSRDREVWLAALARHRGSLAVLACALFALQFPIDHVLGPIYSSAPFSMEAGSVDLDLPAKALMTLVALSWLCRESPILGRILPPVASASFGIFFVHEYVIQRFVRVERWFAAAHPVLSAFAVPVASIGVVLVSLFVVRVVQQALGRYSRLVIGC